MERSIKLVLNLVLVAFLNSIYLSVIFHVALDD